MTELSEGFKKYVMYYVDKEIGDNEASEMVRFLSKHKRKFEWKCDIQKICQREGWQAVYSRTHPTHFVFVNISENRIYWNKVSVGDRFKEILDTATSNIESYVTDIDPAWHFFLTPERNELSTWKALFKALELEPEHWIVNDDLARRLREKGEPVETIEEQNFWRRYRSPEVNFKEDPVLIEIIDEVLHY